MQRGNKCEVVVRLEHSTLYIFKVVAKSRKAVEVFRTQQKASRTSYRVEIKRRSRSISSKISRMWFVGNEENFEVRG